MGLGSINNSMAGLSDLSLFLWDDIIESVSKPFTAVVEGGFDVWKGEQTLELAKKQAAAERRAQAAAHQAAMELLQEQQEFAAQQAAFAEAQRAQTMKFVGLTMFGIGAGVGAFLLLRMARRK